MSENEDYDELPPITVNSTLRDSSSFSMPSAEALADERARAAECEREILRLREEHDRADREGVRACVAQARSDSSGSEGEAALAAAVGALRVKAAPGGAGGAGARLGPLLAAMLPHLPAPAPLVTGYMDMLEIADDAAVRALTDELVCDITELAVQASGAGGGGEAWSGAEVVEACAWLAATAASRAASRPARAARALHLLLEDVATDEQVRALSEAMASSALSAEAALELCDALACGAPRADRLARAVALRALAALAHADTDADAERVLSRLGGVWRRLPAPRQYIALQLVARVLPAPAPDPRGEGRGAARLLDALAQAQPGRRVDRTADALKVLVAAAKLQVLFRLKN